MEQTLKRLFTQFYLSGRCGARAAPVLDLRGSKWLRLVRKQQEVNAGGGEVDEKEEEGEPAWARFSKASSERLHSDDAWSAKCKF